MDIHHLHIFTAVYRFKSFTRAARHINISQPTVSEHIKNLERELECRLFDRIGKGIEATLSAQKLYPKAQQILAEVANVKAELLGGEDTVKGEIILGASTIPGTYIIPPVIKRFQAIYPEIFFQVRIGDSSQINHLILENELVCGIVGAKVDNDALSYEPFCKDRLILVAPPGLIPQKALQIDELADLPFVTREEGSGTRKAIEDNFARLGFKLQSSQITAEFSSTASIKEAAKCGIGVAVMSQLAVSNDLRNGTLQEIGLKNCKMERYFYQVRRKNRTQPSHYLKFCKLLNHGDIFP